MLPRWNGPQAGPNIIPVSPPWDQNPKTIADDGPLQVNLGT